ncbi:AMP-binding protein [Amycolatopsis sp. PS_44_ISF1]|uniref:AMP-binding protein n=1 Tax=Amycolatopsis sp. PS_44_ISF1 TaxID=2974917 RepID=UPI0028DD8AC1|nr:AMP-binding protein [Amycolatopsis sp. PS_44_ISF1]MDT8913873.1 AMP-binding protein [Amycolatopsis sp. PS_44_ISF1]
MSVVADASLERSWLPDGSQVVRCTEPLAEHAPTLAHAFRQWAAATPGAVLAAERTLDGWRELTYAEAAADAAALGQALLDRGLGPDAPLLVLSGNSLNHLRLTLAGYLTGVPVVPVSAAYSLRTKDHARLRAVSGLVRPGLVFAEDGDRFGSALAETGAPAVVARGPGRPLAELRATAPTRAVEEKFAALTPGTTAKFLFTSGSTGLPKGVLNTHRMLSANQQMLRQIWPFLTDGPPVLTDWLPWSHTFGGNHNLHLALTNGGSLYIDDGSPRPGELDRTVDALRSVPPTVCVNVPAGYAQLVRRFTADPPLAARVLSRVDLILYAGADLPDELRSRLREIARRATGRDVPVVSSWGSTETGPAATSTYGGADQGIGIPLPGTEIKLAPVGDRLEIRVRGASVTPGYLGADFSAAVDEDGFYRSGDAVRMAGESGDPRRGLVFEGRIAEDFKLDNGTWVVAGRLRNRLLSAAGVLSDAVLAGDNRSCVTAIVWLQPERAGGETRPDPGRDADAVLRSRLSAALAEVNQGLGVSGRIERLVVARTPPDLDAGEITDKGQLNRGVVLKRRAELVELLYAEPADGDRVVSAP